MLKSIEFIINDFLEKEIYDIEILVTELNGFQYRQKGVDSHTVYSKYSEDKLSNTDVISFTNTLIGNVRGNGNGEFKNKPLTVDHILNRQKDIISYGFPIIINRKLIRVNFESSLNSKNMIQTKLNIAAYDRYNVN